MGDAVSKQIPDPVSVQPVRVMHTFHGKGGTHTFPRMYEILRTDTELDHYQWIIAAGRRGNVLIPLDESGDLAQDEAVHPTVSKFMSPGEFSHVLGRDLAAKLVRKGSSLVEDACRRSELTKVAITKHIGKAEV
jgi:hypothetical protein